MNEIAPAKRYILVEVNDEHPGWALTDTARIRRAIHDAAESHGIHVRDTIYRKDGNVLLASSRNFYEGLERIMDYTMTEAYRLRDAPQHRCHVGDDC